MYSQAQSQGGMLNGGPGHQRFMQMNAAHKFSHPSHAQPHSQSSHHGAQMHAGTHGGLGHQHTFSGNMGLNAAAASHGFGTSIPNGGMNEDQVDLEQYPEHWQQQLQLLNESRQNGQPSHSHSRKNGATLSNKSLAQSGSDDINRENELPERHRTTSIVEDSGPDWDGIDFSGQGLRCMAPRLFHDYTFLTKLFIDHNKLSVLPAAISNMRNLTHLQASRNQLRELPDTIGMLSKLEQLLVFDNNLRSLPVEIGLLFNLDMLGIEGNPLEEGTKEFLMQHGTRALVTHLRDNSEAGSPPMARPRLVLDDSEAHETFTVLDFNILCDKYASRAQYKYTPAKALEWDYRKELILEELKTHQADIMCLQEVDQENYNDYFRRELAPFHYKGVFWPKSRARTMTEREAKLVDGCAIFYKAQKFICLDKHLIDFGNMAINRPDMKGEHDIFNRVMPRDNIAVVAFFENRMTGSRMIVANAHLHWDPRYTDVKLVQTAVLVDQITKFADKCAQCPPCTDKSVFRHTELDSVADDEANEQPATQAAPSQHYSSGPQIPLIVCGDFNSEKESGVYQLLNTGSVLPTHPDLSGRSYGSLTRDGIAHPFHLRAAHQGEHGEYMDFTNWTPGFSGVIDYIWHSTSLRPRQILGNVDLEYLQKVPGFPNYHFPSDHLPLFAEFAVEQRKERAKAGGDGARS